MTNERILLISPQRWTHIKVSKHNYAIELARMGNVVYFLNPPKNKIRATLFNVEKIENNLFVVDSNFYFFYNLKFHFKSLFIILLKMHTFFLNKKFGKFDIVWSFTSLYPNLKWFKADTYIYHQVDNLYEDNFESVANSADVVFAVTPTILDRFEKYPYRFLITHGVSNTFLQHNYTNNSTKSVDVCYCGNLAIRSLDRKILKQIINENINITFHMIGPYDGLKQIDLEFQEFLLKSKNVILYGQKKPEEIARIYEDMNVFLICYDKNSEFERNRNKASNSHKILEYLSTGKVIIATNIEYYNDKRHLIQMLESDSNDKFPELFSKVVKRLSFYNSEELQNNRKMYAKKNSYNTRINEINKLLKNKKGKKKA